MPSASTRTVDRALDLLAAVTERSALTLSDAARQTDLAPSTALRLLRSLEGAGLVTRDDDGRYRPGAQLIRLGARAFTREPLVELSGEPMRALAEKTGESVYLAIAGPADTAVYIAIVEGTHSVRHTNWVGRTVPLAESAVGRAFRGEVPAGEYTQRTHSVEPDVTALTSPVVVRGAVVGALSTLVPDYRCTDELAERCGRALVAATARIARVLSGD